MTALPQRYESPPLSREWLSLAEAAEVAKAVANTDFVPEQLRGNPAAITACILYGDEVGLRPMTSLRHIAVIDGRPSMGAEAMSGLVFKAGHDLWIEETTRTRAIVAGRRRGRDEVTRVSFTMDDAKLAGLAGKLNWRKYPAEMLIARAKAKLCRAIFADAIGGLISTEELEDGDAAEETPAESTTTRRRRRTTLAPVGAPLEEHPAPRPLLPGETETAAESGPTDDAAAQRAGESAGSGLGDDAPEPSAAEDLITEEQIPKLMVSFREAGYEDRDDRMAFARVIIGRQIETSKELTKAEASRLIDFLGQLRRPERKTE